MSTIADLLAKLHAASTTAGKKQRDDLTCGGKIAEGKTAPLVLQWTVEPREDFIATAQLHLWETVCKTYQVCRINSIGRPTIDYGAQLRTPSGWDIFEANPKLGRGYPCYYKTLDGALQSVENHLRKTHNTEVQSNRKDVIERAIVLDLHESRPRATEEDKSPKQYIKDKSKPLQHHRTATKITALQAAIKVLEEEQRALSAKELIDRMVQRGYWQSPGGTTPWATLSSAIGVDMRRNGTASRFIKPSAGLFALKDTDTNTNES